MAIMTTSLSFQGSRLILADTSVLGKSKSRTAFAERLCKKRQNGVNRAPYDGITQQVPWVIGRTA
jgi:hypothetical protein